jgi:hypothetical protein
MFVADLKRLTVVALLVQGVFGCTTHTGVFPLKQESTYQLSIGGPIVEVFDVDIPLPYLTAGIQKGINDKTNVFANYHLLAQLYRITGMDMGVSWFPLEGQGWRPTMGVSLSGFMFFSTRPDVDERFFGYPVVSSSFSWELDQAVIAVGSDSALLLENQDFDPQAKQQVHSLFANITVPVGGYRLTSEIKWQGLNVRSDQLAVSYVPVGHQGALGVNFALSKAF